MHGGAAPQVKAAAAQGVETVRAGALVDRLNLDGFDADPLAVLDAELVRCQAIVEQLQEGVIDESRLRLRRAERDRLVRVALARAQLQAHRPTRQWSVKGPLDMRHVSREDHAGLLNMIKAELIWQETVEI